MSKAMQLKARIKNLASKNHIPAQAVLQNFMLERLLEKSHDPNTKICSSLKVAVNRITSWHQQQDNHGHGCNSTRLSAF